MLTPTPTSTEALGSGVVTCSITDGIATVSFYHPKSNSLPATLLRDIAGRIASVSQHPATRVVVIRSEGAGTFCAGASFDELKRIDSPEAGKEFFMGFARVMLAMRNCPKPIISRVQGKVVGGGVGIVAASDYVLAVPEAPVRLSELAVGIGPFVVGPAIERKVGKAALSALALDADWRDANWCERHGLYTRICDNVAALDQVLGTVAHKLAAFNPEAITKLKQTLWEGTDSWETLLPERAAMSGTLVMSDFTRNAIAAFERRR
ncbi:MAG TPA: enoyl-CoA hydratase/isomerase family protein [Gemmatimonadaceae bacterium]|jgi:methylglutaconyl-CoA hydratase|nr:enoyl-CoA hydratase/isomerase family protein [Gemmatimonadaceae bacterium]